MAKFSCIKFFCLYWLDGMSLLRCVVKILLVDDSMATLEIVKRSLAGFGYRKLEIKKTSSAKAALEVIRDWQPEILLTDWHMPDMTGLALLQALRQRQVPIKTGMITTINDKALVQQALDAGASFVVSKPFDDDELHKKLLPLVQGAEESHLALDDIVELNEGLALPKVSQLEKLLKRAVNAALDIKNIKPQSFDNSKIPCLMAIFVDTETQRSRAVALLDIYAVCVFASNSPAVTSKHIDNAIHKKLVSKEILDANEATLSQASFAFLDKKTRKNLRLKSVSFIPEAFEKLQSMYKKDVGNRIDFACQVKPMAQGKVTVVGF